MSIERNGVPVHNFGVLSSAEFRHFSHLPELHFSELEHTVLKKNTRYYASHHRRFHAPIVIDLPGTDHDFVLIRDDLRTDEYLKRAHKFSMGNLPENKSSTNYFLQHALHIGRLSGALCMLKRNSYIPEQMMLIPSPIQNEDGGLAAKVHDVSLFTVNDLELMGQLAQHKWVVWFNGAFPTQPELHYHAMHEAVGERETLFPFVAASLNFHDEQSATSLIINRDEHNRPIHSPCYATRDPADALVKLKYFTKLGHAPDLCVVRGSKRALFVLFPTRSVKDLRGYVVNMFPESENAEWKDIQWLWLPSAENIGFILKPSFVSVDEETRKVLVIDTKGKVHTFSLEWFSAHMRRKFDSLHLRQSQIRQLLDKTNV